jgi:DNA modification methylase
MEATNGKATPAPGMKWLRRLKEGDLVMLPCHSAPAVAKFTSKIRRMTPKFIFAARVLDNGLLNPEEARFERETGKHLRRRRGRRMAPPRYLMRYTPVREAAVKAAKEREDFDGFEELRLDALDELFAGSGDGEGRGGTGETKDHGALAARFLVPPFSVLNAREGWWQDRKRAWIALGLRSELGRGAPIGGAPMPMDRAAREYARTFGQDLMRGEHTVVQENAATAADGGKNGKHAGVLHPAGSGKEWTEEYAGGDAWSGSGTSIFDPVLCEVAYRWFSPEGGRILDPFAGGSVRGIVAGALGRPYTGIDIRPEQVEANERNWREVMAGGAPEQIAEVPDNTPELTPVEEHGGILVKRDDLFSIAGVCGGKVRSCWALSRDASGGLVTAGASASPQVNIVAHIARRLGLPCRVHVPTGALTPEVEAAKAAGAEIVQHKPGYNSVIVARAREDAAALGWTEIPFGMECEEAIRQTRRQVANLPESIKRIVAPVGSGMSLAGILHGLKDAGRSVPVLGVCVGADPAKRLDEYAPKNWREMVKLVEPGMDYHAPAEATVLGDLQLDPHYEAKCLPFLREGDLFWVVGIRQTARLEPREVATPRWIVGDSLEVLDTVEEEADFVFSCPPYADLEVYSDNPRDISTMDYDAFLEAYRGIIAKACARLKENRFACFVVGDVRDKKGAYRNFVSHTIAAFEDAGLRLYNEAILVTAIGSLPVRVGKQFSASRKLGKTHQNILVFVKGDGRKAAEACGTVDVSLPEGMEGEGEEEAAPE